MPMWSKIYLQNSNSPLMEHLIFFHDHSMILISVITILSFKMMKMSYLSHFNQFLLESQEMELFWTSMPALMLIFIAIPSLKTLYLMEENMSTLLTIKTTGFQWYWNYDYSNNIEKKISSSIYNSMKMRSETANNALVVPSMVPTRMLISSKDVIHSWTLPALGVKSDATPGRINQIIFMVKRPSIMIGQCSEICGAGHSFMPIFMETPNMKNFLKMKLNYFM